MKFEQILKYLREGKNIRRKLWIKLAVVNKNSDDEFCSCDGVLFIEDVLADDWEIVE